MITCIRFCLNCNSRFIFFGDQNAENVNNWEEFYGFLNFIKDEKLIIVQDREQASTNIKGLNCSMYVFDHSGIKLQINNIKIPGKSSKYLEDE